MAVCCTTGLCTAYVQQITSSTRSGLARPGCPTTFTFVKVKLWALNLLSQKHGLEFVRQPTKVKVVGLPGLARPSVSSNVLYISCTQTSFATDCRTCVLQCTVYCRIAEQFKSDDEVKVSDKTKDVDATEEVYFCLENWTNFDREFLGS